jgi:hypothetical protein
MAKAKTPVQIAEKNLTDAKANVRRNQTQFPEHFTLSTHETPTSLPLVDGEGTNIEIMKVSERPSKWRTSTELAMLNLRLSIDSFTLYTLYSKTLTTLKANAINMDALAKTK